MEIHFYVYYMPDALKAKRYQYVTRGKVEERFGAASISELAKHARNKFWKWRVAWSEYPIHVTLRPYSDIEIVPYSKAMLRCVRVSDVDAEIFWRIFSRTEKEALQMRENIENAQVAKQ